MTTYSAEQLRLRREQLRQGLAEKQSEEEAIAAKAVQLLRERLPSEQLAQFDVVREPLLWAKLKHPHYFNVTGSHGGQYTVSGVPDYIGSLAWVGCGFNAMPSDWCVHIRPAGRHAEGRPPVADQMFAFKLTIETDERDFLLRAHPLSHRAINLTNRLLGTR